MTLFLLVSETRNGFLKFTRKRTAAKPKAAPTTNVRRANQSLPTPLIQSSQFTAQVLAYFKFFTSIKRLKRQQETARNGREVELSHGWRQVAGSDHVYTSLDAQTSHVGVK